jgi:hypothetical protein
MSVVPVWKLPLSSGSLAPGVTSPPLSNPIPIGEKTSVYVYI